MPADFSGQFTGSQLMAKRVAVGSGTQTAAGVDVSTFIENCMVLFTFNEVSTSGVTSLQVSLLDSADNTTFAASTGLPTVAATTAASGTIKIPLDTRLCKKYVQGKVVTASTTATFDVGAVIVGLTQVS